MAPARSADEDLTLNALFARSVARHGDALALKDAAGAYTYRELDARVGALAGGLRRAGVAAGDPVVVYAERTASAVVALLAVMRAGGVFVPVNLDTPPRRLDFVLRDTAARVLLVDREGRTRCAGEREGGAVVMGIEETSAPVGDAAVGPGDLAYIVYTSGTSGEPKGIMVEHGSLARRFHDWDAVFALSGSPHRVLQLARLGFDVFLGDVAKALCSGGALVICPTEDILDPARLHRRLVDESIDYLDTVPAVLRPLVEYLEETGQDLAGLRIINCGADAWTWEEYQRSLRVTRVGRLFNGYGVTECTVESTLFEDDGTHRTTLPIGRALGSDEILVLDDELRPVPPGVAGQLCIGGPCVARGYLNRPELDGQFFVRAGSAGEPLRLYKTGDLARAGSDGVFEFLGRIDSQIKVSGYRIEVEEIERALELVPDVRQAVVCYDEARRALIAFVRTDARVEPEAAIAHLAGYLPPYMVPAAVVAIDQFPATSNGKLDRPALLRMASAPGVALRSRAARVLRESRSAGEMCERLERLGIDVDALVREFVKPTATFTFALPAADEAGDAGPLPLRVILDDGAALTRRRDEVAGERVEYLATGSAGEPRIRTRIAGLEVQLDFTVRPGADAGIPVGENRGAATG